MKHLLSASVLLSEPSFLKFLKEAYRAYIYSDDLLLHQHMEDGATFDLTLEQWLRMSKSGAKAAPSPFVRYAAQYADKRLYKDWEALESLPGKPTARSGQPKPDDIITEINQLKKAVKNKDYLQPIAAILIETLDRMSKHHDGTVPLSLIQPGMKTAKISQPQKLRWNADKSLLYALIQDLRAARTAENDPILGTSPAAITNFIMANFVDAKGEDFIAKDIRRHFAKSAKRIAYRIKLDFSDL